MLCIIPLHLYAATDKRAEIVVDVETGRILHSYKSDHIRHPASLTKLMTLYLMFEAIDSGRFTPDSKVVFSQYAANKPPSKLGIRAGRSITMRDAAYTLIIRSANDVATAIGETISGSEKDFAALMTKKARSLGMTRSVFFNASGLPDVRQVTTAKDMAILGLRIMQHYPHYYKYFSTLNKTVAGVPMATHNHLLKTYKGMDGMKTGFVNMSGFNLVSSAERNGKRLITVVMGGQSYKLRDNRVVALTDMGWQRLKNPYGYRQFIGISMPQLAALNTSFRPLEAKQPNAIMTASLVPNRQRNIVPTKIQAVRPLKSTEKSVHYNLKQVSDSKNSGWQEVPPQELPASGRDEIANLIENSQKKQQGNILSLPSEQKPQTKEDGFQPIPVDDALRYDAIKIPNSKDTSQTDAIKNWSIQVGAFSRKNAADNYLNELMKKYNDFSEAQPELVAIKKGEDYIYRARFSGLSPHKAKQACSLLKRMGRYCLMSNPAS